MNLVRNLLANFNYVVAVTLFLIGFYTIAAKSNLIKKFIGFNIMETSVFLFVISMGMVEKGKAPIIVGKMAGPFVNPLPQALILTGIVVAVSTTSLALSLMIRIYEHCGTLEADELRRME